MTTRKLSVRLNSHWADPGSSGLAQWFAELRALGLKPTISCLETCALDAAGKRETHTITLWRLCGADLLNVLNGGDGATPLDINAAMREKISAANRGRKRTVEWNERNRAAHVGKKRTLESRAKQSATTRGVKKSPAHAAKIKAANTGKKRSEKCRAEMAFRYTGRKATPETRAKMKASQVKRRLAEAAVKSLLTTPPFV